MKNLLWIFCVCYVLNIDDLHGQSKINFVDYVPDSLFQEAKNQNKPIFLYATLKGCMPCKVLEYHTFSDSTLANLIHKYMLPAKLNVTDKFGKEEHLKRSSISKELNINAYPTMLILDSEGKEIERVLGGLITPDSLIKIITKYTANKQ